MRRWLLFALIMLAPTPVLADGVVADLSSHVISVTTGFTGVDLIVFGHMDQPSDVAVVVEGPEGKATVRKKSKHFGLWVNTDSFVFDNVPGYYAVATSKPTAAIAAPDVVDAKGLDLNHFHYAPREGDPAEAEMFKKAFVARREARGLYRNMPSEVTVLSDRLFRTTFNLPANVPIGRYKVHVYLLQGGQISATETLQLDVHETGISATIFEAARSLPIFYAGAALVVAIAMGASGAWLFQRIG